MLAELELEHDRMCAEYKSKKIEMKRILALDWEKCEELWIKIGNIKANIYQIKKDKLQYWLKSEFDLHYFDKISFGDWMLLYSGQNIYCLLPDNRLRVMDTNLCYKFEFQYYIDSNFWSCRDGYSKKGCLEFMRENRQLLADFKKIFPKKDAIKYKFVKYSHLFFSTNYLQCLTFLLCNSFQKIFCRDIEKLIAQKIFFIFFFFNFLKKLKKKKNEKEKK